MLNLQAIYLKKIYTRLKFCPSRSEITSISVTYFYFIWGKAYERFSRYISPGPEGQEKAFEYLRGFHSLSHRRFIFIFQFVGGYFQLFLVYLEKWLCKK